MNTNYVQNSDDMHHHHSTAYQDDSVISTHDHHSMMGMYFHAGFIETILFYPWITSSIPLFLGSWIFIFILGVLYEGIKELRQTSEQTRPIQKAINSKDGNENELECINIEPLESTVHIKKKKIPPPYTERALDSILYIIQLTLSYSLMLIAMTFNVYLFFAIIFGIGAGHLLYSWSRLVPSTSKNQSCT